MAMIPVYPGGAPVSGGSGSGVPPQPFLVAAAGAPDAVKAAAAAVCDGTNDQIEINAALVAAGAFGRVVLAGPTFTLGGSVVLDAAGQTLDCGGATLRYPTVTGTTPIVWLKQSNCVLASPRVQGSGAAGLGIGILLVRDPGVTSNGGVHDCVVTAPTVLDCAVGIEFGIHVALGDSSGDNNVFGGDVATCATGVMSRGFTNRLYGTRIATCNTGIDVTTDRQSAKIECYGLTVGQWSTAAIRVRRGTGSVFANCWLEHTDAARVAQEAIVVGSATANGDAADYEVVDCRFAGTTKATLATEQRVIRLVNSRGLLLEALTLSTNGTAPTEAVVKAEATCVGPANRVRRIDLAPGSGGLQTAAAFANAIYPAPYLTLSANPDALIVEAHHDADGTPVGSTLGEQAPKVDATYSLFKATNGTKVTYYAKRPSGHVALAATDTATTSGLQAVLATLVADQTYFHFCGPRTQFWFIEEPTGHLDHFAPNGFRGLRFEGDAGVVIANWRDDTQAGYDTLPDVEPISCTRCDDLTFRNLEIYAGGNQDLNNSSDTFDFDGCSNVLVEHCKVRRSRARALVMDGGDDGAVSSRSRVAFCEFAGIAPPPKATIGPAGALVVQTYRYVVTYVDSLYGETPCGDPTVWTATGGVKCRLYVETGPAYSATKGVTARKIYRWSTAQPTYRLLTTLDNTVLSYDDNATDASIASAATVPLTGTPLIPAEGIKFLGSKGHDALHNTVIGTGSHNIQIVRKGSDAATNKQSDRHAIESNLLAHAGCGSTSAADASVYVGGGDFARIVGNDCRNPGMPGALGYGIYLQGLGGATTAGAVVVGNTIHDDRTATHPHGAAGMLNGIRINLVAGGTAPSDATLGPNAVTGSTGAAISDTGGTNTHQYSETTHNHSGTGAGALTLPLPRWIPGRYYGTRAQVATGTNAGQALTANQAIATPFYAPDAYAVVEIACSITTVVAGSKVRMAIYLANETDGRPASLVVQTGDLSGATLGKLAATIATTLQAQKWYWAAVLSDQAISVNGFTGGQPNLMGSVGPEDNSKFSALRAAIGAGWSVFPSSFPASPSETATTPLVEVKI